MGTSSPEATTTPGSSSESIGGPACGDGALDPGEDCDDGNDIDADGCNHDCVVSASVLWSVATDSQDCSGLTLDAEGSLFEHSSDGEHLSVERIDPETGATTWETPIAKWGTIHGLHTRAGFVVTSYVNVSTDPANSYFAPSWQTGDAEGGLADERVLTGVDNGHGEYHAFVDDEDMIWWFVRSWIGPTEHNNWVKLDLSGNIAWREWQVPTFRSGTPLFNGAVVWSDEGLQAYDRQGEARWPSPLDIQLASAQEFGLAHQVRILTAKTLATVTNEGELLHEFDHGLVAEDELVAFRSIVVDASGNTVVHSLVSFENDAGYELRRWLAKYSAGGDLLWTYEAEPRRSADGAAVYQNLCGPVVLPDDSLVFEARNPESPDTFLRLRIAP